MRKPYQVWLPIFLMCLATVTANAQSFRVQCPTSTALHPTAAALEPAYSGPGGVNGAIKCQQISGGDGYATMGDGTQTYLFRSDRCPDCRISRTGMSNRWNAVRAAPSTLPYDPVSCAQRRRWSDARPRSRGRSDRPRRSAADHGSSA